MVAVPETKRLSTTLARDNVLQVRELGGDDWVTVYGLRQLNPKFTGEMQDDADINGRGFGSNIATGLSYTIALDGLRKGEVDGENFTEDPGQAIIRLAGTQTGFNNVIEGRTWRSDGTGAAYESEFSVEYTTSDGDRVALDAWTATLMSRGEPQRIDIPTELSAESVDYTAPVGD